MPNVYHFLSLPADMHSELTELAAARGITFSDLVLEVLAHCLEEEPALERKIGPASSWCDKFGLRFAA